MTFNLREILGGKPRYLYTFMRANTVWRHTGAGSAVTVVATGLTYTPGLITHGRMERNAELRADSIAVRLGRTMPVADALLDAPIFPMSLRIEKHQPADDGNVPIVLAFGDVSGMKLVDGFLEFDLVTGEHRFGEPFPSKLIERQSQWAAFSAESGIDEREFSYATTISAIDRWTVTVADIGIVQPGYYDVGQMKFGSGPTAKRVFIDHHVGALITPTGQLPTGTVVGDPVTLVAGDDKMLTTWRDKFGADAVNRFMGFDLLPTNDPLQTGLLDSGVQRTPYAAAPASPESPIRIYPRVTETADDVTIAVRIVDPETRLVIIEYRSNPTGDVGDWTAWDGLPQITFPIDPAVEATVFGATIAKVAGFIAFQVRVTTVDGESTGTWEFGA